MHIKRPGTLGVTGVLVIVLQCVALQTVAAEYHQSTLQQVLEIDVPQVDALYVSDAGSYFTVTVTDGGITGILPLTGIFPLDGETLYYSTNGGDRSIAARLSSSPPMGMVIYAALGDTAPIQLSDEFTTVLRSGLGPGTGSLPIMYSADVTPLTPPGDYSFSVIYEMKAD